MSEGGLVRLLVEAGCGVYWDAVYSYFEVEVGAGGSAGHAYCADCLAALDVLALAHEDLRAVAVERGHRAAVVDDDRVAVAAVPAGEDDAPAGGGGDRGALGRAYVDAGVHLEAWAERVRAQAEGRRDGARDRPAERAGRARVFGREGLAGEQRGAAGRLGGGAAAGLFLAL